MCDAISVSLGAAGIGTLLKASASMQQGAAAKAADYRSADFAERSAADAIERGNLQDLQQAMHGSAVVAAQRVAQSGSGADVNVGAPLAVQQGTEAVNEVSRAIVRRNARLQAYGLTAQAQGLRQRGEYAEAAGKNAALGTFLGGMGELAGMGGRLAMDKPEDFSSFDAWVAQQEPGKP